MSPIRITPGVPVHMCANEQELSSVLPTTKTLVVEKEMYVRPEGKKPDYNVRVEGFQNEPGGIIESQRLSPSHNLDDITLTTAEDDELSGELGLSEVTIDGVIYTATNSKER